MDKKLAYILGYFYADGYLKNINGKRLYPALEIVKSDGENITACLDDLKIKYTKSYRFRKNSKNEQISIRISALDKNIALFKNVLSDKINMSNVLNYITDTNMPYFLRGFFDGDGCINIGKKSTRLYFYGSYDQKWDVVTNLLTILNINFTYQKIERKSGSHKSSMICISNRYGINILFEHIYPFRIYDFGLSRKFNKLELVKSLIKSNHIKLHKPIQLAPIIKIYT